MMSSRIKWKGSGIGPRTNRVAPLAIPAGFNYDFFFSLFSPSPPLPSHPSRRRNDRAISSVYILSEPIRPCLVPATQVDIGGVHCPPVPTNRCQMAESNQRTCRRRAPAKHHHHGRRQRETRIDVNINMRDYSWWAHNEHRLGTAYVFCAQVQYIFVHCHILSYRKYDWTCIRAWAMAWST